MLMMNEENNEHDDIIFMESLYYTSHSYSLLIISIYHCFIEPGIDFSYFSFYTNLIAILPRLQMVW